MSLPIPQLRVLPFGDVKYEDRATQIAAGQALAAVTATAAAAVATSQGHGNHSINALRCSIRLQPSVPLNGKRCVCTTSVRFLFPLRERTRLLECFILFLAHSHLIRLKGFAFLIFSFPANKTTLVMNTLQQNNCTYLCEYKSKLRKSFFFVPHQNYIYFIMHSKY